MTTPTASNRIVVDSSGWVEYLGSGPKADEFAIYLESTAIQFLPSIVVYEVCKKLFREQTKQIAYLFISRAFAFGDHLIPLTLELSILASQLSLEFRLTMADAIIYATACHLKAQLITSDAHFSELPGSLFYSF